MSCSLGQGLKLRILDGCPKERYIDPMLRTVKDAPECPKARVNYPALRTVKSVQTFGGPTVVGSIREFRSVRREATEQARRSASGEIIE